MATEKASSSSKKSTIKASSSRKALSSMSSFYKSLKKMPLVGIIVAEFIGTFILTASFFEMQGNPLFFAFALIGAILIVGSVSGAHLNPAITVGAWAMRKINSMYAFFYILAQILGAITAWLVLNAFLQNSADATTTSSVFHAASLTAGKEWYIFFAELLGVTILSLGVATAVQLRRNKVTAAFAAGFAVLTALYISMSITTVLLTESGVSFTFLNPAIAIAANGLSWNLWPIAIYLVAPVIGGVIGFVLQDFLHSQSEKCECEDCK